MFAPLVQKFWKLRDRLGKGSFGHNVLVMFFGTALGQLGPVLAAPVLTRLYSPEMFGVQGAFTAALFITAVVAALRYEMAIPLAKTEEDVANLIALCFLALIGMTGLLCFLLWFFSPERFDWAVLGAMDPYRWWLPVGFVALGTYQIMVYVATQQHDFKTIATTKLYQGIAGPVSQIGMGLAHLGTLGLIIGFIIGQSMGTSQFVRQLIIRQWAKMCAVRWSRIKSLAIRYKDFPLLSSWSGLINAAGSGPLLALVLPMLYSTTVAGYVFLADRIIGRPLLMISTSILQVYVGETAELAATNPAAVRRRFLQLLGVQTGIVSTWLLAVNLLADWLFPLLFGAEWGAAVPYLHVVSIALLPQLVTHALLHTLQVLERQKLSAIWEVGRLCAVVGALVGARYLGFDALDGLLAYSICQAGAQLVLLGLMYSSIQQIQEKPAE